MIKLNSEEQILNLEYRKLVIEDIISGENVQRKKEHLRRQDIYKDHTVKWVVEKLAKEGLQAETIALMTNRAANVSVCRKIIDKLAQTYLGNVRRETEVKDAELQIKMLEDALEFNEKQKKSDRWLELHRNCITQVVPVMNQRESSGLVKPLYDIKMRIFSPAQYDVLAWSNNPEQAACIILSEFVEQSQINVKTTDKTNRSTNIQVGDRQSKDYREFIWWSDKFHFTTDIEGQIVKEKSPEDFLNQIQIMPFSVLNDDQDGHFWAQGGADLIDGSILINTMLTDINSIAYMQGWGQTVITGGESLPQKFTVGPHHALILTYDKDNDPKPEVSIVSPNPPIESWLRLIEQYVALLLSTNNLSPSNVSMRLDPANFPSGVAMMIEQAQSTEAILDKQNYFTDREQEIWSLVFKWMDLLSSSDQLTNEFAQIGVLPVDTQVQVKFEFSKAPMSEKERLELLKLRQELGLNTELDLIMLDNPDLSEEQAEQKLLEIKQGGLNKIAATMQASFKAPPKLEPADADA